VVAGRHDVGDGRRYWLVLERPEASICFHEPGFEVDLFVAADTLALHRVWMAQMDLAKALRDELIVLDGPAELRRGFSTWLALSVYAWRGGPPLAVAATTDGS
jgi:hypothetical protein